MRGSACSFVVGFVLSMVGDGCVVSQPFHEGPDLLPLKPFEVSGPEGFCDLSGEQAAPKLAVTVANAGAGDAPSSVTRIEFFPGGTMDVPTPLVPAGEPQSLTPIAIPPVCFDPDCEFRITVDARNDVDESTGEGNNAADGRCLKAVQ